MGQIQDSVIFQSADECKWVLGQEIRQQSLSLVKSACLQLVSEISSKLVIYEVDCARTGIRAEYFRNRQQYILSLTHLYFFFGKVPKSTSNFLTPDSLSMVITKMNEVSQQLIRKLKYNKKERNCYFLSYIAKQRQNPQLVSEISSKSLIYGVD
ncbi:Hypothetical_protein [Hexamita inflata]|uniref:Hypothetical_protein n=1 Tax=Hexamita inflata TaxID=28002 RepID=A0AA86R5N4_9EUKA|nr:Hypothetical protein HINF_LOCUS59824 [Hexamita inflata]